MGLFDFDIPEKVTRSGVRRLKPLTIYKVKFMGIEPREITSLKTGEEKKFRLLDFKFENEEGNISLSMFYPNEQDAIRQKRTASDGHEYEAPSNWEQNRNIILQTISVINPKAFEKFREVSKKFRSFDDLAQVFMKLLEPNKGDEVYIKFDGYINKSGYLTTTFPKIVGVNHEGELFISDNYIAKDESEIALSSYELSRKAKLEQSQPSTMDKDPLLDVTMSDTTATSNTNKADLDIDALLAD